jgi:hypothetical protein
MSTLSEVRALIKPFTETHPDFFIQGRMIALRPLHHMLRSVFIENSSGKGEFKPYWVIQPLCIPIRGVALRYGFYLWNHAYGHWNVTKPNTRQVLLQEIEEHALPLIEPVQTLSTFMNFSKPFPVRENVYTYPQSTMIMYAALGQFDTARAIWINILQKWSEQSYLFYDWDPENMRRHQALGACLMSDDGAGVASILHDCEAYSVKNLKLEKIWQPTPFDWES